MCHTCDSARFSSSGGAEAAAWTPKTTPCSAADEGTGPERERHGPGPARTDESGERAEESVVCTGDFNFCVRPKAERCILFKI